MKRILLYLFCLLIISRGLAQSTLVFSKQYNFGNSFSHLSFSVFNYGNDFLLAGLTQSTSSNFGGIGIIKLDSLGNVKWQKQTFGHTNYRYTNNTANQFFKRLSNGNIVVTGQYPIALNYTRGVLARINQNNGDTLWVKEYTQPGDTSYLQCTTEQSDSSLIILGYKYFATTTSTPTVRPFMMKTDKSGNYLWHKYLFTNSINYYPMFQKICRINDNDFIAICINHYSGTNFQSAIMRLDTNANVTYSVGTTGVNNSFLYDVLKLQDGNYLSVGSYFSYNDGTNTKSRKLIYKFDGATGAKITDKRFNWQANTNGMLSLAQQVDGAIIVTGLTGYAFPVNTYYGIADILKLSSNLDSIRTMYLTDGVLANDKASSSFILMPDGGYALAMQVYPASGQQKFWLIKTDSLGCDSASCTATAGIKESTNYAAILKAYPNPADNKLYVDLSNMRMCNRIELVDVFGIEVKRINLVSELVELNIDDLEAGAYFLKLYVDKNLIGTKKLIKN